MKRGAEGNMEHHPPLSVQVKCTAERQTPIRKQRGAPGVLPVAAGCSKGGQQCTDVLLHRTLVSFPASPEDLILKQEAEPDLPHAGTFPATEATAASASEQWFRRPNDTARHKRSA